jgi:serine/threonine-protein kinase RsbW
MPQPQLARRVAVTPPARAAEGGRKARLAQRAPGLTFTVRSTADLSPVLDALVGRMEALDYLQRDCFGMRLALEEALVNALKHGHGHDPAKSAHVRLRVTVEQTMAEVEDEGPGFDPSAVADALQPENLERSCGRGLLLMRHYTTWVRFNDRGNRVTLCKCRSPR